MFLALSRIENTIQVHRNQSAHHNRKTNVCERERREEDVRKMEGVTERMCEW